MKSVAKTDNQIMYQNAVNIGTEEITQEDLNTPILKIVQSTSQDIENKKDGSFYRTDLKEQFDTVKVNLVYVSTIENDNYNKTAKEKVKVYFGFYAGTNEPFKMYLRGWGIAGHRDFQTEVMSIKNKYQIPMLSLTVNLKTEKQTGTIQDTGKPYTIFKPIFEIEKNENEPVIEMKTDRISFLVEASNRFREISLTSVNDEAQNEVPVNKEDKVNPEEIPF